MPRRSEQTKAQNDLSRGQNRRRQRHGPKRNRMNRHCGCVMEKPCLLLRDEIEIAIAAMQRRRGLNAECGITDQREIVQRFESKFTGQETPKLAPSSCAKVARSKSRHPKFHAGIGISHCRKANKIANSRKRACRAIFPALMLLRALGKFFRRRARAGRTRLHAQRRLQRADLSARG